MRLRFEVSIDKPRGYSPELVRDYIEVAVRQWAKGESPEDPIWDASDTVNVKQLKGDQ